MVSCLQEQQDPTNRNKLPPSKRRIYPNASMSVVPSFKGGDALQKHHTTVTEDTAREGLHGQHDFPGDRGLWELLREEG